MQQRLNILQSKLTMPKVSNTLQRNRLIDRVKEISHKRLALIIAGAGYGKTTLVAQTVADMETDTVWYCLDESDKDFATCMGYLVAGIAKHQPGFGKELRGRLSVASPSPKNREVLLLEFLAEVENRIPNDMIIVLDDYYMVQDSPEISGSMEFLLARIPPLLHMILISRTAPALRVSRYRAMLEVIDVGEAELSFQVDEIEHLYRGLLDVDISETNIQKLFEKTGGWVAGLILFFNAVKGKPSGEAHERLFDLDRSKKFIFQYLEENVFERQSDEIKDFMVKSSLLSRLAPAFCDMVFKSHSSRDILNRLCENHLLTFPCGDAEESFQYHHLLQDFLRDKLERDFGRKEVDRLHHHIARSMEERGDIPGAMRHFLEGMHFGEICRIIAGMVFKDFMVCPFRFFMETFDKIPEELIREDARLMYVGARLASLKGDIQEAISVFRTALERFRADGNAMGTANCLKDLGLHYYLTGDVTRAKEQMEQLWGKTHEDPFFPAEVAGYLILFSAIAGKMEEADHYYGACRKQQAGAGKEDKPLVRSWLDFCYSYRFHNSGDFDRADELNLKTLHAFSRLGMEPLLPLAHFQAALTLFFKTRSEEGYAYAEKGLSLAEKIGIHDAQYAWLLYTKGLNGFGMGGSDQAIMDAEKSLRIFQSTGNLWGQACVYELYGMIYRKSGKKAQAEAFIRTGRRVVKGLNLTVTEGALALRLAEVLLDKGQYADASSLLDKHREEIEVSKFHLFKYYLLYSRIHTGLGRVEKAVEAMETGLAMAWANHYDAWVLKEPTWVVPVLARCYALGIAEEYIERILRNADREARDVLWLLRKEKDSRVRRAADDLMPVLSQEVPAPLRIHCLGRFEVFVGGQEIARSKWQSTKATKLFKYMVMRRDHGFIPKEILLELAWPDEDPGKTNRRFHVAMTSLRRLLEPDLKRGVPSSYILKHNDAYRLEIGKEGRIDFQEFLRELELAERIEKKDADDALTRYLKAESMYGGRLFEEDPYEDWLMDDRETHNNRYLKALSKILFLYEKKESWKKCIDYAEKYLSIDRYAEPVYNALMGFYSQIGQTSRIVKTFERCKTCLTEDLGCPLNDSTVTLYKMLTVKNSDQ
jgi:ATP/maltotriose-dependent transcriptional regulator MalT/DNA-binding SARP family transcriptional activator